MHETRDPPKREGQAQVAANKMVKLPHVRVRQMCRGLCNRWVVSYDGWQHAHELQMRDSSNLSMCLQQP